MGVYKIPPTPLKFMGYSNPPAPMAPLLTISHHSLFLFHHERTSTLLCYWLPRNNRLIFENVNRKRCHIRLSTSYWIRNHIGNGRCPVRVRSLWLQWYLLSGKRPLVPHSAHRCYTTAVTRIRLKRVPDSLISLRDPNFFKFYLLCEPMYKSTVSLVFAALSTKYRHPNWPVVCMLTRLRHYVQVYPVIILFWWQWKLVHRP